MQALAEWLANSWWMLVAGGLGALGLWLVYLGLLADRARGRRRCPKCWYELGVSLRTKDTPSVMLEDSHDTSPGGTGGGAKAAAASPASSLVLPIRCSECGREATSEQELLRTHRRWGVVFAGVVLIAIAPWTRRIPDAVKHGPARLVPTWALLQLCGDEQVKQWTEETLLFGPKATSPFAQELVRRGVEEAIPAWQSEMFERRVRRYLVDKGEAVMPSGEEEILRRLDGARLPSDRSIAEMEELFAEVGKALGTRVEVDWESMWAGRVLKTDKVGLDTRGLPARVAMDRVMGAKATPVWLKWTAVGGGLKCEMGRGMGPRELRGVDVGDVLEGVVEREWLVQEKNRSRTKLSIDSPVRDNWRSRGQMRSECLDLFKRVLTGNVVPEWWTDNGGELAQLAWMGDRVIVHAPVAAQLGLSELIVKLRKPVRTFADLELDTDVRSSIEVERFVAETTMRLDPKVVTRKQWLEEFQRVSKYPFVMDESGGFTPTVEYFPRRAESTGMPLGEILSHWIRSRESDPLAHWLRLSGWHIDHGRIFVPDDPSQVVHRVVVAYEIGDILNEKRRRQPEWVWDTEFVDQLRQELQEKVARGTWYEHGGDSGGIQSFGTLLIVSQTERNQIAVARLLDQLRESRANVPELRSFEAK